jgi:hypothetical protein
MKYVEKKNIVAKIMRNIPALGKYSQVLVAA